MKRTTIMLPHRLRASAIRHARTRKISFGEFVRQSLEKSLRAEAGSPAEDPFWTDHKVWTGPTPPDLSEKHDDYLYGDKE